MSKLTSLNNDDNAKLNKATLLVAASAASLASTIEQDIERNEFARSVYIPSALGASIWMGVPTHDVTGLNCTQSPLNCDTWYSGRSKICNSDLTVSSDPSGSSNGAMLIRIVAECLINSTTFMFCNLLSLWLWLLFLIDISCALSITFTIGFITRSFTFLGFAGLRR